MHQLTQEFTFIHQLLQRTQHYPQAEGVVLGIGDDTALLCVPQGYELAVTTDTMVEGNHFDQHVPARAVGHKLASMNISDLAAMGAQPRWLSCALTAPQLGGHYQDWLVDFMDGFLGLLAQHKSQLIGGDVTRGPLSLTVTAQGLVPQGQALKRKGAKPGDLIVVSGYLGDAALALAGIQGRVVISPEQQLRVQEALFYPQPQVALGQALLGLATSCIDLSDGLIGDLQHILSSSGVGAELWLEQLPYSAVMSQTFPIVSERFSFALSGGEDYQLCFTIPLSEQARLQALQQELDILLTVVGEIREQTGLTTLYHQEPMKLNLVGYQHFQLETPSS